MWVKPVCNGWDKGGTLISKFEEKFWDIDIKKITVSHCDHIACIPTFQGDIKSNEEIMYLLKPSAKDVYQIVCVCVYIQIHVFKIPIKTTYIYK